jgi:hypothetical protein
MVGAYRDPQHWDGRHRHFGKMVVSVVWTSTDPNDRPLKLPRPIGLIPAEGSFRNRAIKTYQRVLAI